MRAGKNDPIRVRERNAKLFQMYLEGRYSYRELADLFGITHQRVYQVVQRELAKRMGKTFNESIPYSNRILKKHRRATKEIAEETGLARKKIVRILRLYQKAMG